jgi:hypothetical protein
MKEGNWGFPAMRKRRRGLLFSGWFWLCALTGLLLAFGLTPGWPQSSGLSSSSSSSDLQTWEKLSEQFATGLTEQSGRLRQALTELEASKASSEKLTLLLGQSLKANAGLKTYSEQLARRMQERDEDLARAYGEIGQLEKKGLRLITAVIILAAVLTATAVVNIFFKRR